MSYGLAVPVANSILNQLRAGAAWSMPAGVWVKLHTGDPGAAGTANPSALTARQPIAFAAAASGVMSLTGAAPSWTATAAETLQGLSFWDTAGPTGGTFLWSSALSTPRPVIVGDPISLISESFGLTPGLAA